MHPTIQQLSDLLHNQGGALYYGEQVTEYEHGLQAAYLAEQTNAPPSLVIAALLHDIGHMLHGPEYAAAHGIDDAHEELGYHWLQQHFGDAVAGPARLHVAAKRYLCGKFPEYLAQLSPASQQSLQLQGGPMTEAELHAFEQLPYAKEAIQLRHWDDEAKKVGLQVPEFEHYVPRMEQLLKN